MILAMPNDKASRRTLNRFKEHKLSVVEEIRPNVPALNGAEGAYLRCTDQFCGWAGWFPTSGLTITKD